MSEQLTREKVKDGFTRVFDKHLCEWRNLPAIDAREQLSRGLATLKAPTMQFRSPAGLRRCTADMVPYFKSMGGTDFTEVGSAVQASPSEEEPADKDPEPIDFSKYRKDQLLEFAALAEIKDYASMSKADLVNALDDSGFRPTT